MTEHEIKQLMKLAYQEGFNSGVKSLDKGDFAFSFNDKIDIIYNNFRDRVK